MFPEGFSGALFNSGGLHFTLNRMWFSSSTSWPQFPRISHNMLDIQVQIIGFSLLEYFHLVFLINIQWIGIIMTLSRPGGGGWIVINCIFIGFLFIPLSSDPPGLHYLTFRAINESQIILTHLHAMPCCCLSAGWWMIYELTPGFTRRRADWIQR